ncbi:MAG: FAD-dependent oxidoreductase [Microbacteriaceae bacterium]
MSVPASILVVGGGLAGHTLAATLRRSGYRGRVTVLEAETNPPYDRPALSKGYLLGALSLEEIGYEPLPDVELLLGTAVTALDVARRRVECVDGRAREAEAVVLATGAAAVVPDWALECADDEDVHALRDLADADRLRAAIGGGGRLAVLGGGFVGVEAAGAAAAAGVGTTLVHSGPAPLAGVLPDRVAGAAAARHEDRGIRLHRGRAHGLRREHAGLVVETGTGPVTADGVLLALGGRPRTGWLRGGGVRLRSDGRIACDTVGRTDVPGVFAVGDCARWGEEQHGGHWDQASLRAQRLAMTLLGEAGAAPEPPPYVWSDHLGVRVQLAGDVLGGTLVPVAGGSLEAPETWTAEAPSGCAAVAADGVIVGVIAVGDARSFGRQRRRIGDPAAVASPL